MHTHHTNIWGPASITSYNGFLFYLIMFYDCSQYIWHFLMARKYDVAMIPTFLMQMENQFNTCVKIIQNNGSGEFVNKVLQTYLLSNAVIHRL